LFIDGAHKSMPKGRPFPTRRGITVRIGTPLPVSELKRLTEGLKSSDAAREAANYAREAVELLGRGQILDLKTRAPRAPRKSAPLSPDEVAARVLHGLPPRFQSGAYSQDLVYYITLTGGEGPRYTLEVTKSGATVRKGKPEGSADCVIKTSIELFRRICEEAYVPDPSEFISGTIKVSEIPLLIELSTLFNLSEPIRSTGSEP